MNVKSKIKELSDEDLTSLMGALVIREMSYARRSRILRQAFKGLRDECFRRVDNRIIVNDDIHIDIRRFLDTIEDAYTEEE